MLTWIQAPQLAGEIIKKTPIIQCRKLASLDTPCGFPSHPPTTSIYKQTENLFLSQGIKGTFAISQYQS